MLLVVVSVMVVEEEEEEEEEEEMTLPMASVTARKTVRLDGQDVVDGELVVLDVRGLMVVALVGFLDVGFSPSTKMPQSHDKQSRVS